MCGIVGIASLGKGRRPSKSEIMGMLPALNHRGPDGHGVYIDDHVALGHTRLSIIDLSGGAQPIHNENRTIWVSFNGEIFNYIELRQELQAAGHRFYTRSDTEVIVHAYEQWGDPFVERLNGQFAIALWDAVRHRLTILRDRPGILPLFYIHEDGRLRFASEIKSLLATFSSPPVLDPLALDQIFTGWTTASPRTVFDSVREVPPGHRLVLDSRGLTVSPYWRWEYPPAGDYDARSEATLTEELHSLLADATSIRLRADVPVAAYLSGGLDSSALVALIQHGSTAPLKTFSIGFESAEHDEREHQEALVEHLGVRHSRVLCDNARIGEDFSEAVRNAETPILRTAPVPMRLLSGEVRSQGYKVVLTGEGADEVFGGYDIFKEAKIRRFWSRQPESIWRPLLLKRLYPWLDGGRAQGLAYLRDFYGVGLETPDTPLFSHQPRFRTTAQCKRFFSGDFAALLRERAEDAFESLVPPAARGWDPFNRSQQIEARTLMSGYLLSAQGDRMLMANSVEGRFPFLDHRVMEFAAKLDPRLKMRVLNEKYLLKRAMREYLPASIVVRHKQPYRAPDIPAFFTGSPIPWRDELLSEQKVRDFGYFDPRKVDMLVAKARAGRATAFRDNMALVGILSTQLWHHHFVERFEDWLNRRPSTLPSPIS